MSKITKRSIAWIVVALMGIPLSVWPFALLASPANAFSFKVFVQWREFLTTLPETCYPLIRGEWELVAPRTYEWDTWVNISAVYALFALGALLFSIYLWCKRPQRKTLLAMFFCGWILCGFPGQFLTVLPYFGTPGDGPDWPYSNNYVQMPDGRVLKLVSEGEHRAPLLDNGYYQVLPDGRSFYVVPSK